MCRSSTKLSRSTHAANRGNNRGGAFAAETELGFRSGSRHTRSQGAYSLLPGSTPARNHQARVTKSKRVSGGDQLTRVYQTDAARRCRAGIRINVSRESV